MNLHIHICVKFTRPSLLLCFNLRLLIIGVRTEHKAFLERKRKTFSILPSNKDHCPLK